MPFGPGDRAPTPSGRLVVDFLNGRMPGYVDTVLNVVHVDDVAGGHLLAHDRGAAGRTYILGGENLSLQQILAELASITGLPTPRLRVPHAAVLAAAILSDIVEGRLLRRPPHPARGCAHVHDARWLSTTRGPARNWAMRLVRLAPRSSDSMRWFVDAGYVHQRAPPCRHPPLRRLLTEAPGSAPLAPRLA